MFPVIYDFGEVNIFGFSFHPVINSYGFMLMIAFYTCYYFLHKDLKRLGYKPALAGDVVFAAAIGGIIGSRIYFLLENFEQFLNDPIGMIFSGGGLVFLGGLLGGLLAVTYVIRKNKLKWIVFADIVAPLLILGYAIGRIGCLLVGDDYGLPTHLLWGMEFPNGIPESTYQIFQSRYPWVDLTSFSPCPTKLYNFQSAVCDSVAEGIGNFRFDPSLNEYIRDDKQGTFLGNATLKVHPTQIYETLIGSGIFYYLYQKRQSVKVVGSLFFTYLTLAGTERFMIEFLRINQKYFLGLSGAQLISLTMISIGLWFLYHPVGQTKGYATEEK